MPKIPSYLVISRHGVYYLRVQKAGVEKRVSLRTKNPHIARAYAYQFGARIHSMDTKTYNIKLPSGIEIQTDGTAEDHERAMEALREAQALEMAATRKEFAALNPLEVQEVIELAIKQAEQTRDSVSVASSINLSDAVEDYLAARRGDVEPRTITSFRSDLNRLISVFGKEKQIHEIKVSDIDKLFDELKNPLSGTPKSKATIKNIGSCWKNFWECSNRDIRSKTLFTYLLLIRRPRQSYLPGRRRGRSGAKQI